MVWLRVRSTTPMAFSRAALLPTCTAKGDEDQQCPYKLLCRPAAVPIPHLEVQLYCLGVLPTGAPHVSGLVVLAPALVVLGNALVVHLGQGAVR